VGGAGVTVVLVTGVLLLVPGLYTVFLAVMRSPSLQNPASSILWAASFLSAAVAVWLITMATRAIIRARRG
jgi:hypothetical protein